MKKVGIVSCDKWKGKIKEDLMLQQSLLESGIITDLVSWQDSTINFSEYDCLILRSVWGYQNDYEQFKNWLLYLKTNQVDIYNDVDMVLNNIRKDKQLDILDRYSISHIPTIILKDASNLRIIKDFCENLVIKPLISGSGKNTFLLKSDEIRFISDECSFIFEQQDNGIMVQPFISGIENGEYACIYIDGVNTHNMLRYPGVLAEKKRPMFLSTIPNNVSRLAERVSQIPEFKNSLYMRVDIVLDNNEPKVMEVELAEPDLLIKYIEDDKIQKDVVKTFTKRIERRLI